jgi:glucose/arabinose dehydrogenase
VKCRIARASCLVALAGAWLFSATTSSAGAATLPAGFTDTAVITGLVQPTVVRFAADGRVFVAEKDGRILVYHGVGDRNPTVFADLRTQVDDYWDRGLLGLALAPNFPADPSVYALYTYDAPLGGAAPVWYDACPTPPGPTTDGCVVSARLVRFTASGDVAAAAPTVLAWDWCQQFPSHSIGSLQFGADGALYVSGGDGASFSNLDYGQFGSPVNPCGDPGGAAPKPPGAEGGSLRSQDLRTAGDPVGLSGAILRIDPSTGEGMLGNPLFMSADPNARRIVAEGLRNPFRFTIRPGTNDVWIGDVGAGSWEEIDRIANPTAAPYANFGWPCYEGAGRQPGFDALNLNICEHLYTDTAQPARAPYYTYAHTAHVVAGDGCATGSSSISGLAFSAGAYPPKYAGALFFADYSRKCIWAMLAGANGLPDRTKRMAFVAGAANPVDLETGPDGNLYYVDLTGGTIHRVAYTAGNRAPVAVATATPASGIAPMTVTLDGTGSSDPDPGDTLTYAWDANGDGVVDSTSPSFTYTYPQQKVYVATLQVTDSHGASSTASVTVTANNTAPQVTIDAPLATRTWAVGDRIAFQAHATDAEDGSLPASSFTWTLILHHCPSNCHTHFIQSWSGVASGTLQAPDHEYPSWLELRVTATDSGGLQATSSVRLNPRTVVLRFTTKPAGLKLVVNGVSSTAPFTRRVIAGSANTVTAPSPQSKAGSWLFSAWSDRGARTHTVIASSAKTLTATYHR